MQLKRLSSTVTDDHAYADDAVLAYAGDAAVTWKMFLAGVAGWQARIATIADAHVAIHMSALDDFLACLWACWRSGKIPVVSSNSFRGLEGCVKGPLGDGNNFVAGFAREAVTQEPPTGDSPALVLFTSGSSGAPQQVTKQFSQLDAELFALESLWGDSVRDTIFVSTVSHHHMFGLPFGLLWPLLRGSAFFTAQVQYPESLEGLARRHELTLITSPVQLDNLHAGLDWNVLGTHVKQIFSAGAPLAADTAQHCLARFGRAVTEIYGSTETGAVAWRAQPDRALWQCLPGVSVACAHAGAQLRIDSVAAGRDAFDIADTGVVHADGRFELLGRADRIVKVGGKRVSLVALDSALAKHPWVRHVRTLLLPEKKQRLGAVVALTAEGNRQLVNTGKAAVSHALKEHLSGDFDRVSLPRYWRFVPRLPVNTEDKTTQHALGALFASQAEVKFPELESNETVVSCRHHRLTLRIPENLHYFSGHFPGSPVLPGVVQIAWAIHYGKQVFTGLDVFSHLEAVKFQHVIVPDHRVCLDLQWNPDGAKLLFAFSSARAEHSSGRILFRQP